MTDIEIGPFRGTVVRARGEAGQNLEFLKVTHCWAPHTQIALLPLDDCDLRSALFLWFAAGGRRRDFIADLERLAQESFFENGRDPNYEGYVYDADEDEGEEEVDWRETYDQDERDKEMVKGFMDYLRNRPGPKDEVKHE